MVLALRRWVVLAAVTAAAIAAADAVGVPSAALVAALVAGIGFGALVQSSTLGAMGRAWLPVLRVSVATLALSVIGGLLLGLHRDVDPLTGSLALTAGGTSGLTAISCELGADERVVAVLQLRHRVVPRCGLPGGVLRGGYSRGAAAGGSGARRPG